LLSSASAASRSDLPSVCVYNAVMSSLAWPSSFCASFMFPVSLLIKLAAECRNA